MPNNQSQESIASTKPPSPAPYAVPQRCRGGFRVDGRTLRQYIFSYIYIWNQNHTSYWMYLTKVDNTTAYGYVWHDNQWVYAKLYHNEIECMY